VTSFQEIGKLAYVEAGSRAKSCRPSQGDRPRRSAGRAHWRFDELCDIAVDSHVSPEPIGDEIGTGPITRLAEARAYR
jgi:hypothetical protein